MSTSARRSPRNHTTSTMHPTTTTTSTTNASSTSTTTVTSSRHLSSSTLRNHSNHHHPGATSSSHAGRSRYSGSPKEASLSRGAVGSSTSTPHGISSASTLSSSASTSAIVHGVGYAPSNSMMGSPSGSGTNGLGIIGGAGLGMGGGSVIQAGSVASSHPGHSGNNHNNMINHAGHLSPAASSSRPPPPPQQSHHFSPYHTRSTPNLTAGSTSGSSPILLSPGTSPVLGPPPQLREPSSSSSSSSRGVQLSTGGKVVSTRDTHEPLHHGEPPSTPTKTQRATGGGLAAVAVSSRSPERETSGAGMAKYRSGYSVEGILMQSGGADKVNTTGTGTLGGLGTRNGSGRNAKGKGVDYGDRFIPQRSNNDLHASYTLLPDGPEATSGYVPSGIYGEGMAASMNARRAEMERSRKRAMMAEGDGLRDEADRTYSNLLKTELFGPNIIDRPSPTHTSSAPNLPLRHAGSSQSASLFQANSTGDGFLGPIPAHSPSTPRTSAVGAFASGGGPRSSRSTPAYSEAPVTPTKRRVLDFSSPTSAMRSSPTSRSGGVKASPGNIGLGHKSATGVSMGLDDMMHEKYSLTPMGRESQKLLVGTKKPTRWISKTPFKVLDAPELADDFYLNLVSWSSSNLLAVGLRSSVYIWTAATSDVSRLCDFAEGTSSHDTVDDVTGLEWTNRGSTVAIGTRSGKVEIWDAEANRRIRTMNGHTGRVGALAWNGHVLSTGSRDRTILHRDTRVREHYVEQLKSHRQEVCGLKWNPITNQLASGGNDNKLYIWDKTNPTPLYKFSQHCAAVKALAWSPHHSGLLATGGGTADKKIRYWNTLTGSLLSEWDTGSQVCNLMWAKNSNEIVSTHGYSGGAVSNQICLWKYPSMNPVATLTGHTLRVLYLAMSPDGQTIVTGAGDETLRFWNAFQKGRNGEAPRDETASEEAIVALREKKREESELNPFVRIR